MKIETEAKWISVQERLPKTDELVETKICNPHGLTWCLIRRKFQDGRWKIEDPRYSLYNEAHFAPTHWVDNNTYIDPAKRDSEHIWEQDCVAICGALGIVVTVDNTDDVMEIAMNRISALKHIILEYAACGECDCHTLKGKICDYCVAGKLALLLGKWENYNEAYLKDFMYENFQKLPKETK